VSILEFRGEFAVASGWFARAQRLLEGCEPCAEHGWLALHESAIALEGEGDAATGRRVGSEVAELGRSLGRADLELIALAVEGLALVFEGEVEAGLRQLDHAAAAAVAGEVPQPVLAGWACCYVLYACESVRDHARAEQWARQTQALAERMNLRYLFRVCRTHLAGVLTGFGAWENAEAELRERIAELRATRPLQSAEGVVRLAELRRRQGRVEEAASLFAEAEGHPQAVVGEAAIALAAGDAAGAADSLTVLLRQTPAENCTARTAPLELLVEARVATGELASAREAHAQLAAIAARCRTPHLRASARFAAGLIAVAENDLTEARIAFEDAVGGFRRARSPFECIRARLALAGVLHELGRVEAGRRSADMARDEADRLGATAEHSRAVELLAVIEARPGRSEAGPLTARECEVLRLVADGLTDGEIAKRLVLSLHTVHRHVANIRHKLGTPSRAAAVATARQRELI
jgi:LuxR family transcriptional regulator, maltose regulon positive regulatory protein